MSWLESDGQNETLIFVTKMFSEELFTWIIDELHLLSFLNSSVFNVYKLVTMYFNFNYFDIIDTFQLVWDNLLMLSTFS